MLEVRASRDKETAKSYLSIIDEGYLNVREGLIEASVLEAASALAQLVPGPDWADNQISASTAHFHFASDVTEALKNYDPHLIDISTRFGYITWPKRIQKYVKGKSVVDVGCGFGGFGPGFLAAGARNYMGLDPVMKLDSTRAKNKRKRVWDDMGVTPNQISQSLPAVRLHEGTAEDFSSEQKFDTISLHNVTEHLIHLESVFGGLIELCKPDTNLVFLHHNFFCWNGHHFAPSNPTQIDENNQRHQEVLDWRHIEIVENLPDDHYFKTKLNRVRLDEIRAITEKYFDIIEWNELPSNKATLNRLTPEVIRRIKNCSQHPETRVGDKYGVLCSET